MLRLAERHDLMAIEIRDPREQELPDVGELWLVDPETGRQLRVDTGQRKLRERFAQAAGEERQELAALLRQVGADHVVLSTAGDWLRYAAWAVVVAGGALVGWRSVAPAPVTPEDPQPRTHMQETQIHVHA